MTIEQAIKELRAIGVTTAQMGTLTGFGLRHVPGCQPVDWILNKYAAGALTRYGVMAVLYGVDSPEHHAGSTLVNAR
jgi:hypothetical protein